jgi:deoxyribonucleoside regulator
MDAREQQALDAAKLYYVRGLSQDEVAQQLGVSRPTVSKLIQTAKDLRFVTIDVHDPREIASDLGDQIARRFGLAEVRVAAGPVDPLAPLDALGRVGATLIEGLVRDGEHLGLSWGESMYAVAQHLAPTARDGVEIVELKGGVPLQPKRTREYETMSLFCAAFNAYPRTLHIPVFLEHVETVRALEQERQIQLVLEMGRQVSTAAFTVGHIAPDSTLFALDYFTPAEREHLSRHAAGDIFSRFYDDSGRICLPDLDDRTVALPLADLSAIERRVCIAGGRVKSKALAVALAAGFITHLATDSAAAQGILEYARRHGLGRD